MSTLYTTLVSEIMLQQTTVPTVLKHYHRFLERFPTLKDLALASEKEVLLNWQGLGYYRRARNLHKAALSVYQEFDGEFPLDLAVLQKIPGIGLYTASAICAIGANQKALPVDANLERVLARLFLVSEQKGPKLQKKLHQLFNQGDLLKDMSKWGACALAEAFMDLGRTICKAQKAECSQCPMQKSCLAYKQDVVFQYPQDNMPKARSKKLIPITLIRYVVRKDNKILFYKKSEKQWLSDQYELPTFVQCCEDGPLGQYPQYPLEREIGTKLKEFKSSITQYKINNLVYELTPKQFESLKGKHFSKLKFLEANNSLEHFAQSVHKSLS